MNPLIERLKQYCHRRRISYQKFAKQIGIARQFFYRPHNLGADKLAAIAEKFPDLSISWLITGKGQMLKPMYAGKSIEQIKTEASNTEGVQTVEELKELYDNRLESLLELLGK